MALKRKKRLLTAVRKFENKGLKAARDALKRVGN
jgi:hypothetical protein